MKTIPYERAVAGPDTLRLYLKEISQFPQLTPEEEQQLGARVKGGDEEAFRKLIEANLRFVVAMAKKYARSGYPLHELINEGNLGLIEAVSRFDPSRGVRFITYASWWIRQAILAAIAHHGQVFRLPPKLKHELYRFETKVSHLTQELGHRPSVDEISEGLGMKEEEVREMIEGTPIEVSLSTPVGEEGETHLEDLIEDQSVAPVDELLIAQSFEEQLQSRDALIAASFSIAHPSGRRPWHDPSIRTVRLAVKRNRSRDRVRLGINYGRVLTRAVHAEDTL